MQIVHLVQGGKTQIFSAWGIFLWLVQTSIVYSFVTNSLLGAKVPRVAWASLSSVAPEHRGKKLILTTYINFIPSWNKRFWSSRKRSRERKVRPPFLRSYIELVSNRYNWRRWLFLKVVVGQTNLLGSQCLVQGPANICSCIPLSTLLNPFSRAPPGRLATKMVDGVAMQHAQAPSSPGIFMRHRVILLAHRGVVRRKGPCTSLAAYTQVPLKPHREILGAPTVRQLDS